MTTDIKCELEEFVSEDLQKLLENDTPKYFFILWSVFESKIFDCFATIKKIEDYIIKKEVYDQYKLDNTFKYFHERYQDSKKWKNLNYKNQRIDYFDRIREKSIDDIDYLDKAKFLLFVILRFRNNIFHGKKGVDTWLSFKYEIDQCTLIMMRILKDRM